MSHFVAFVALVVAAGLLLGPVRDRYRSRTDPRATRLGAEVGRDADLRRLGSDLRAAADRQSALWERQLDLTVPSAHPEPVDGSTPDTHSQPVDGPTPRTRPEPVEGRDPRSGYAVDQVVVRLAANASSTS